MKLLIRAVLGLVLLLVLVVVAGFVFIDDLVVTAVERGGTYALGVDTKLEAADIGLFSGHFALKGFEVDNPPGFQAAHILSLEDAGLDISIASLAKDTIVVPRLLIAGVTLDIEQNDQGSNYGVLIDNLERLSSGGGSSSGGGGGEKDEGGGGGKNFVLEEVVIRNVRVTANVETAVLGKQEISYTLPELVLTDLGSAEDGKPLHEQISLIVQALLDGALKAGIGKLPDEILKDFESKLAGLKAQIPQGLPAGLTEKSDELLGDAQKQLEGLGEKVDGASQEVSKEVQDAAKKAQDALKNNDLGGFLGGGSDG